MEVAVSEQATEGLSNEDFTAGQGVESQLASPKQSSAAGEDQAKKLKYCAQAGEMVFPEEMLEKIVSRMSFPSLFKARLLCKFWYFKFPMPSQLVKSLSPSLQKEILSVSSKWPTYCPVFISKEGILGFDRSSGGWKRISLSMSYLPVTNWSSVTFLTSAGSLACVITEHAFRDQNSKYASLGSRVFVTNVLTRSWRELELPAFLSIRKRPDDARILQVGTDSYMVLLLYHEIEGDEECIRAELYDSSLRSWCSTNCTGHDYEMHQSVILVSNSAYLHGTLYCMCLGEDDDPCQLSAYHLTTTNKSWIAIPHSFASEDIVDGGVLLCGEKIMVVIWVENPIVESEELESIEKLSRNLYTFQHVIQIFELDRDSWLLEEVATGPPTTILGVGLIDPKIHFASDADHIYFGQIIPSVPVMTYNLRSREWDCLPPPCYTFGSIADECTKMDGCAFAPGMNPFAIV